MRHRQAPAAAAMLAVIVAWSVGAAGAQFDRASASVIENGLSTPQASAPTPGPTPATRFEGRQFTGSCLDSDSAGKVYTHPCNHGLFQSWLVGFEGQDMINGATGRCLTAHADLETISTELCRPGDGAQNWKVYQPVDGRLGTVILNDWPGHPARCVDASSAHLIAGCGNWWTVDNTSDLGKVERLGVDDSGQGLCLDSNEAGDVYLQSCHFGTIQQWVTVFHFWSVDNKIQVVDSGLINLGTGRCLEASFRLFQTNRLVTEPCDPNSGQRWASEASSPTTLRNAAGLYLRHVGSSVDATLLPPDGPTYGWYSLVTEPVAASPVTTTIPAPDPTPAPTTTASVPPPDPTPTPAATPVVAQPRLSG